MTAPDLIHLEDLALVRGFNARPGFCRSGARNWFARHGLDWSRFRLHGLPAADFLQTGDALGIALVEQTLARRASELSRG